MARRNRTPPKKRRSELSPRADEYRQRAAVAGRVTVTRQVFVSEAWVVPTRWVKFFAALVLLPVCWVASRTFFDAFSQAGLKHHFWTADEFYFFALGVTMWLLAFFLYPRPLLVVYVFGHELTHAIWVLIQGGRVSEFKVARHGGYIIADRRDFLVSLAPYFFPIYSILVLAVWALASWYFPDAWYYRRWMFGALGMTWGFHLSFTCWMIPKQQTDLLLHGTFFSLVVIYLANLIILTVGLIVACPQMHWDQYGRELVGNAAQVFRWACEQLGVEPWRL